MRHLLVADIGGTTCHFAWFTDENGLLHLERKAVIPTADLADTSAFMAAWAEALPDVRLRDADALVAAVSGPVTRPLCAGTTNAALRLDLRDAAVRHGFKHCEIINDFAAQAYACLTEIGAAADRLTPGVSPSPQGSKGVLGAGTGLGAASLAADGYGN